MHERIIKDPTELMQYIHFFERYSNHYNGLNKERESEGGSILNQICYSSECDLFIKWVYETNILKIDYLDYLNQHSITLRRPSEVRKTIESADSPLLRAILTYYIRGERICSGLFECATKEGIFLAILKQMQCLQDQS
ncbi:MAG: DUF6508 domain-containing protein [Turicibacter sp.]